jgi:hypothetical protein
MWLSLSVRMILPRAMVDLAWIIGGRGGLWISLFSGSLIGQWLANFGPV